MSSFSRKCLLAVVATISVASSLPAAAAAPRATGIRTWFPPPILHVIDKRFNAHPIMVFDKRDGTEFDLAGFTVVSQSTFPMCDWGSFGSECFYDELATVVVEGGDFATWTTLGDPDGNLSFMLGDAGSLLHVNGYTEGGPDTQKYLVRGSVDLEAAHAGDAPIQVQLEIQPAGSSQWQTIAASQPTLQVATHVEVTANVPPNASLRLGVYNRKAETSGNYVNAKNARLFVPVCTPGVPSPGCS